MNYDDYVDTTQDNTQIRRIMSDFDSFLQRQSDVSSSERFLRDADQNSLTKKRGLNHDEISSNANIKVKIKKMETQHSSEKQALIQNNIALESKCSQLNSQISLLQEKCDKLQLKNKQLTDTNLELIDKLENVKDEKSSHIENLETNYVMLEKIKKESDERMYSELSSYEETNQQLQEQNMCLQSELNTLSLRLEEALSIGELYNKKISETKVLVQQHQQCVNELAAAKLEVHSLSTRLHDVEDIEKIVKSFKEDMDRLRSVETAYNRLLEENETLKENQENAVLLSEKLLSAERKLSRAQEKCQKVDELEIINEDMKRKFDDIYCKATDQSTLHILQTEITQLKSLVGMLTEKNQVLQGDCEISVKKHNEKRKSGIELKEKIDEQTEICASLTSQLQRLKKHYALVSRERDSLRQILQSYDAELTMTSHTTQLSKRLNNAEEANKRLHARITQLENELQKNTEDLMRQRLLAKQMAVVADKQEERMQTDSSTSNQELEKEIADLKNIVDDREKEKETLLAKIDELEGIVEHSRMGGEYDRRSEKIVHFTMNPAASARQKFKQDFSNLKEENLRLKKKLMEVEEGRDVSVSEIQMPESVREELARSELRNKRLKEVFSKKIQEYRKACYSLTGYRIDTSNDMKFRLVSMYAESENDYLLFEMQPDSSMQLLETEFSKSLQEMISLHLHHQNSIPMFLNALTVNLFSQQTIVAD